MYSILELQTTNGVTQVVLPIQTAEGKNEAMSKYHGILFAAAVSPVECHTAMVIDQEGKTLARESYYHSVPSEETGGEEE